MTVFMSNTTSLCEMIEYLNSANELVGVQPGPRPPLHHQQGLLRHGGVQSQEYDDHSLGLASVSFHNLDNK